MDPTTTASMLAEIADTGRDTRRGGYSRHVFDRADTELRTWFAERAIAAGLDLDRDPNGNLWAWWGPPGPDAVVTGSHLDSVPGGGAFDGPLGVATALEAVTTLAARGLRPAKPVAVVVFAEEEGGRFGLPCLGSRLLTGSLRPEVAARLTDADGTTFVEAARGAGLNPDRIGADPERLARIGTFLELHVEQGRGLIDLGAPVAIGSTVLEHGRWRLSLHGQGNHAGATALGDRSDPMLPAAHAITAARRLAADHDDARLTVGRMQPTPGGTNVIASHVDLWLDARVPGSDRTRALVDEVTATAAEAAHAEGCHLEVVEESFSPQVRFDQQLRADLGSMLDSPPELPTGAGHDAAVLAAHTRAAMLYVRNPTGISHAPDEHAEDADIAAGARALTDVLERIAT